MKSFPYSPPMCGSTVRNWIRDYGKKEPVFPFETDKTWRSRDGISVRRLRLQASASFFLPLLSTTQGVPVGRAEVVHMSSTGRLFYLMYIRLTF